MSPVLRNALLYLVLALVGALIATGVAFGDALTGDAPLVWRPLIQVFVATFFGTLSTTIGASLLPRLGSEALAALVNEIGRAAAREALERAALESYDGDDGDDDDGGRVA